MDQRALKQRIGAQLGRPSPKPVILRQLLAVLRFDTTSRLGQLEIPTLILRAGEDILVSPHHSYRLEALIPKSTLIDFLMLDMVSFSNARRRLTVQLLNTSTSIDRLVRVIDCRMN